MGWLNILKAKTSNDTESKESSTAPYNGDIVYKKSPLDDILKSYIPNFLYKPPFGYPRQENIDLLRKISTNPYIFSVIKTICDEAASSEWDIVPCEDVEDPERLKKKIKEVKKFFNNPNGNSESFNSIIRAVVKDICEIDSGVLVKVFNQEGLLSQIFARDGGSFLKNPDIYGYMGARHDFIYPVPGMYGMNVSDPDMFKYYELNYKTQAAYFQYGWTGGALPVPFGKREIIYLMQNPRTDSIYGISPIRILTDVILTLVYGAQYNLDFYMNSNLPEGVISLIGAQPEEAKAFKERFENEFRKRDEVTGFWRKIGFKFPVSTVKAEFTPFQMPSKDLQILEQQQWFTKVVWACFGVTADEMGFTETSNRSVGEVQTKIAKRKAVRPILKLIEYHINQELIPEFGSDEIEFKYSEYDIDEEMKKYQLYQQQVTIGVMTPEMVAKKEGIDIDELQVSKKKMQEDQVEHEGNLSQATNQNGGNDEKKPFVKSAIKDPFANTKLEKDMVKDIESSMQALNSVIDLYQRGALDNVE